MEKRKHGTSTPFRFDKLTEDLNEFNLIVEVNEQEIA